MYLLDVYIHGYVTLHLFEVTLIDLCFIFACGKVQYLLYICIMFYYYSRYLLYLWEINGLSMYIFDTK